MGQDAAAAVGSTVPIAGGGDATQPLLPAAGPTTRPIPPPLEEQAPSEQEEVVDELSVSDLLIEDDEGNDDLDLGDFE